jgi:phosphoribosylformimino-5-aminoimidazole carboxamide ribotide isomerase
MDLYARVNILEGKAVRLPRGNVNDEVIFLEANPLERAHGWVSKGANRLLVVDLDAAAHGDYRNRPLIYQIIASVDVPVQVGGGVRTPAEVDSLLGGGAWRVTMGTTAMVDQVLFWDICRDHPGRIAVSLDVLPNQELAIRGWTEGSGSYLEETLIELSSAGAAAFMLSEVGRDALNEPPNFDNLRLALTTVEEEVIAAGGVRGLEDLELLRDLDADGRQVGGVVVGREITAGRFTFEEAVALVRREFGPPKGPWSAEELQQALATFRASHPGKADAEAFLAWLSGE